MSGHLSQFATIQEVVVASIDVVLVGVIENLNDEWMTDLIKFFATGEVR